MVKSDFVQLLRQFGLLTPRQRAKARSALEETVPQRVSALAKVLPGPSACPQGTGRAVAALGV